MAVYFTVQIYGGKMNFVNIVLKYKFKFLRSLITASINIWFYLRTNFFRSWLIEINFLIYQRLVFSLHYVIIYVQSIIYIREKLKIIL